MRLIKTLLLLWISTILLAACGPSYTPEQIAQMQEKRQEIMERYRQQAAERQVQQQQIQPKPVVAKQVNLPTEQEIGAQIGAFPQLAANSGVLFQRDTDGFTANDERFTDYEGEITYYAFDGLTGDVTYLAKIDDRNYVIKFVRATVGADPLSLATVIKDRGTWKILTTTGKRLSGSRLLMTSKGFVIIRRGTAFLYEPGKGITNIASPKGYRIAKYQTGDIASTRNILMEKIPEKADSLGALWSSAKGVGGLFGGEGNQDYILYNIETKKETPLLIGYTGDKGLYDYHGQGVKTINSTHYFWRAEWFKVPSGTYVVYVVNGIKSAKVIHLDTGLDKTIFERMLGIKSVNSYIQKNGKIRVVADMGFGDEVVDDLETFMLKGDKMKQK